MASLGAFQINPDVRQDGEWVDLQSDIAEGVAIRTRGFTDAYTDARGKQLRRAVRRFKNNDGDIPAAEARRITIELLIAHSLVDVRGLENADGTPVTFEQFCGALRDQPRFEKLYLAVLTATSQAGEVKTEEVAGAAGN